MRIRERLTFTQNYYSIKVLFSSYDDFICQSSFNAKFVIRFFVLFFFFKQLMLPSVSPKASFCSLSYIVASCNVTQ